MSKKKPDSDTWERARVRQADAMERIAVGLERFLAIENARAEQFDALLVAVKPLFEAAIDHLTEEFLKAHHGR